MKTCRSRSLICSNFDTISFNMHGGAPVGIRHFLATSYKALYFTKDMDKLTRQLNAGLEAIGTDDSGLG